VVCDNTNSQRWEYEQYVKVAQSHGYEVHILTIGSPQDPDFIEACAKRNKHGLDLAAIKRMSNRWEL
jgi:predicted kinase